MSLDICYKILHKKCEIIFFFTKFQVHQTAGAASFPCGLRAGTNVWLDTGKIIQFHMTRIQPVRSRAIYCHQADNQPFYYYQILGRNFGGFQTQFGHFTEKIVIFVWDPWKQPKLLDRKRKCQNYTILSAIKMGNNNKI